MLLLSVSLALIFGQVLAQSCTSSMETVAEEASAELAVLQRCNRIYVCPARYTKYYRETCRFTPIGMDYYYLYMIN